MSGSQPTFRELRERFTAGEITAEQFRDRLTEVPADTDKDELWLRWADQGLFDGPITQEGFTSLAGPGAEEVDRDG